MPNPASNRHQVGIPTLCSFVLGNEVAEKCGLLPLSMPEGMYLRIVNTSGLSCKNAHSSELARVSMGCTEDKKFSTRIFVQQD